VVRYLNLSYNTLNFDENHPDDQQASEDFIDNFREYIDMTSKLIHLDLSGLNLGVEQLEELCPILATCDNLQCLHLSDNQIREDAELSENVQTMFSVSEETFVENPKFKSNLETVDHQAL